MSLKAKEAIEAEKLIILLDNDLNDDFSIAGMHKTLVKDMTVKVISVGGEERVYEIKDNYLRAPEILLNNGEKINISEICITINSTYGNIGGVYGIRLKNSGV